MEHIITCIKWVATCVVAALTTLFGPNDTLIWVLLAMSVIDYITGVTCAAVTHTLCSSVGFKGLARKMGIFVIVAVAAIIDKIIPAIGGALCAAACAFYIANEGLSILENWGKIGLPLPKTLTKALAQLKQKDEEAGK